MLTYKEAQKFYDAFGKKQDRQFYEESAINDLIAHGNFSDAKNIVEFGCGTGKLASRLLKDVLPADCHYTGVDISQTMVNLCRENLRHYPDRAKCLQSKGKPILNIAAKSADHFISTYVLDLLSGEDITILLNEACRVLMPGGYLCLAGLTHGVSAVSRLVEQVWSCIYKIKPSLVGGCRPLEFAKYLETDKWHIIHDVVIESYAVPSQVLIASFDN